MSEEQAEDESSSEVERNPFKRTVHPVISWSVLGGMLLALVCFTSLGVKQIPELVIEEDFSPREGVVLSLEAPPYSSFHRLVRVQLQGKQELFLLDSGASETVLSRRYCERSGLMEKSRKILAGVNDRFGLSPIVKVEDLRLRSLRYSGFHAVILDLAHIDQALGVEVSGVLGTNVLGRTAFEIDLKHDTLRLGRSAMAFQEARPEGALDSESELLILRGSYYAEAHVDGEPHPMLIDSGAVPTILERDKLSSSLNAAFAEVSRGIQVDASGARREGMVQLPLASLRVGHVERRNFRVAIGDFNLLGADFLNGLLLRIDPEQSSFVLRSFK